MLALASLFALSAHYAAAQAHNDQGDWRASSSNAHSITGDLQISPSRLFLNYLGFPLASIRVLTPAEVAAVFPGESTSGSGFLYRLSIPSTRRFLNHNALCGSDETQWMVTTVSGRNLLVAFFSGSDTPEFTPDAMNKTTDLCGVFTYGR
jgi:hypothetical protein